MALAFPAYTLAQSLPSAEIVNKTVVASCPVDDTDNCLAAADLLQAVGSFYEIVIMILIALLAVVASFVYLSIRAASKRQIEGQFENDLKSEWLQHRIRKEIDNSAQSALSDLARKVELLEEAVSSMKRAGHDEESVAETTIVSAGDAKDGAR